MTPEQPSQQPRQMVGNLRVIDQVAFDDLSKRLEHLIAEAGESSRRVERFVHLASATSGDSEKVKTELDQRLVLAGRVLKITREQLERIKTSLVDLSARQHDIDDVAGRLRDQLASFQDHLAGAVDAVDRRVAEAVGGLEGQIGAIHEQLGETAESVQRRAAAAVADLATHREAAERAQARADRVLGATTALGERFGELERRVATGIEAFEQGLQQAVTEIRAGGTAAERASSKLDEQVFALKSRVAAFADGLEKWIKPTLSEIDTRRQDVDRATAELRQRFEALDRRFDDAVKALDERLGDGLAGLETRVSDGAEERTAAVRETVLEVGRSMLSKVDDAVRRLEARVDKNAGSSAAGAAANAELRTQLGALATKALGEAISQKISAMATRLDDLAGAGDVIAPALTELRTDIAGLAEANLAAMERRIDDVLERIEGLGGSVASHHRERPDGAVNVADVVGDVRSEIASLGELLGGRVEAAVAAFASRSAPLSPGPSAQSAGLTATIERHLDHIQEQVSAMGARLANFEMPSLGGGPPPQPGPSGGADVGEAVSGRLDELQKQLSLATERLDSRVSEILAAIEARPSAPRPPPEPARAAAPAPVAPVAPPSTMSPGPGAAPPPKRAGSSILSAGGADSRRLINSLLAAINSGSSTVLSEFIGREYAESSLAERGVEERVEVYMSFHEEAGEIGLKRIERATESSVVAVVQETASMDQYRFSLDLEQEPPHKIRVVNIDMV